MLLALDLIKQKLNFNWTYLNTNYAKTEVEQYVYCLWMQFKVKSTQEFYIKLWSQTSDWDISSVKVSWADVI